MATEKDNNNFSSKFITIAAFYKKRTKKRAWLTFKPVFSVLSRDTVEHLNNESKTIFLEHDVHCDITGYLIVRASSLR